MAESASDWFDRLYKENLPKMQKLAKAVLDNREAAEDIVQEVFLILLAKQEKIQTYQNPTGWLYITLRNQIGNYLQRKQYRNTVPLDLQTEIPDEDAYPLSLADSFPAGLTDEEKLILSLYYDKRMSYEETAKRLGCTVLTCRTKLCRARAHYKKLYLEEQDKNL